MNSNKATKAATTKTTSISKGYQKILDTVAKYEKLRTERDLTQRELVLFVNAKKKIEDKSLSTVFKMILDPKSSIASDVKLILGNVKPTFKTLQKNMGTKKPYYSTYAVLCALAKMNPSAKLATKLSKQGGKVEGKKAQKVA